MTEITVVDVETTGKDAGAAVCQLGWTDVLVDEGKVLSMLTPRQTLLDPGQPIEPEAMGIHHITDAMVAGQPPADWYLEEFCRLKRGTILCAHNVAFERRFLTADRWICTMKGARRVWPDAPSHGNQALRYWLGHDIDPSEAQPPHHAGPDSLVTAHTLTALLRHASVEDLIRWTDEPALLSKLHFGKHAGVRIRDVPTDYWTWVIRQDFDEDVMFTARHELERRGYVS